MLKRTHYTNQLENALGKEVVLSGWVHDIRLKGGINFILLRDIEGIAQVIVDKEKSSKKLLSEIKKLHQEDVIAVRGKVVESKSKLYKFEVQVSDIEIISKSETPLPLDPREITPSNLDTKLNWRFLFFRTNEAKAIFKIQGKIIQAFRDFFVNRGYIEMQPPVIISSASEGGAELFKLPYFEKTAYLAQSPQLYKQMGAISFEKVFMIVPVFRAEKFDQPTHLNEIRQMDVEQAFSDENDLMRVLEECLAYILKFVKESCEDELKILNVNLEIPKLPLKKITYNEAINLLKEAKEKINWGDDFSKLQERKLSKLLNEIAFFIKDWPTKLKPFYAMPYENNPEISKSFDLIYKGIEIASGTQRIHDPNLLVKQIKEKGLDPKNFKFYIDCFKYGSPQHAGWSIGLERLTMSMLDRSNIKEVTMFPRTRERISP